MVDQAITGQLVLVKGEDAPQIITLKSADQVVLGRGNNSDITLTSLQISRRHATFEYLNRKWFIRDASTNGLAVGGVKLQKGVLYELKDGELIHLIPTEVLTYRFQYVQPSPNPIPVINVDEEPEEEEHKTDADEPDLLSVDDEDSNQSESLLSVNGGDFYDPLPPLSPEAENDGILGKRKNQIDDGDPSKRQKREETLLDESSKSYHSLVNDDEDNLDTKEIQNCTNVQLLQSMCLKLFRKYKLVETEKEAIEVEKTIQREEYLKKQNDAKNETEAHKEELYKKVTEALEQEFACCICNEIFITPTVVECGHTFCNHCISEWMKKKPECPICRKYLRNITKHVEMDNFIIKIHLMLSDEIRTKRDQQIAEREQTKMLAAANSTKVDNRRRNGVPNEFFPFPTERIPIPFDLLAELQSINDWGGAVIPPPPAHNNPTTSAADRRRSARIQRRGGNDQGGAGRRGRNNNNNNNNFNMIPGMPGGNQDYANNFIPQQIQQQQQMPPQQQQHQIPNDQAGPSRNAISHMLFGNNLMPTFRGAISRGGSFFPAMFPFGNGGNRTDNNMQGGGPPPNQQQQQQMHPPPVHRQMNNMDVLLID